METKKSKPEIGQGATLCGYTDTKAYTVIAVSESGKTITIQQDKATLDPEWKPDFSPGGFAGHCSNQRSQTYTYERNPEGQSIKARLHKDGKYHSQYGKVLVGERREFYDYNF